MTHIRSRAWCFTLNAEDDGTLPVPRTTQTSYICWGVEEGGGGRRHCQGYAEFANAVTLSTVKRRVGGRRLHVERRRGTQEQAIAYTRKDAGAQPFNVWVEHGERRQQGRRTDLVRVRELLSGRGGIRSILQEAADPFGYQCVRYAEKYLTYEEPGRDPDDPYPPVIRWYWGSTGTGKSAAAFAEAKRDYGADVWWANGSLEWFDGYDRHKAAVLDDFRPSWKHAKLPHVLRLFDRYPLRVAYKGGYRQWVPEVIWVTCPQPPENCFLDCGEEIEQLLRRVTVTKFFG